jgi:hypothetical protein
MTAIWSITTTDYKLDTAGDPEEMKSIGGWSRTDSRLVKAIQ